MQEIRYQKPRNKRLSTELIDSLSSVEIVIVDEVSFMKRSEFDDLDNRLRGIGRNDCLFGGFSVIFAFFCQFEPVMSTSKHLLFSLNPCESTFENIINATIFLNNKHCFKHDPEWGDLLKHFWMKGLTKKRKDLINSRVVGNDGVTIDRLHEDNANICYASATHVMQGSIHSRMQQMHLLLTHPDFTDTKQDAPLHAIMIEANMRNSSHHKAKKH